MSSRQNLFDTFTLTAVTAEIRQLEGSRLQKIAQSGRDEFTFSFFRPGGGSKRLYFSFHPSLFRVHLITKGPGALPEPSSFCMLLRKYLEGSLLTEVHQPPLERVLSLTLRSSFGEFQLYAQFHGQRANLILAEREREILGALKPDALLPLPPLQKPAFTDLSSQTLADILRTDPRQPLVRLLPAAMAGLSPLLAREVVVRAGLPLDAFTQASTDLYPGLAFLAEILEKKTFNPQMVITPAGEPLAYAPIPLEQYRDLPTRPYASMSALLEDFHTYLDTKVRLEITRQSLRKTLAGNLSRCRKKSILQENELIVAQGSTQARQHGQLLTANLYRFLPGAKTPPFIRLPPYDGLAEEEIQITLDQRLSPADNAQVLFRRYRKLERGRKAVATQLAKTREEISYLEEVLFAVEIAEEPSCLEEIRFELATTGYLPPAKKEKPKDLMRSTYRTFHTSDGLPVLVGKNNRQNEELTFKVAAPGDLWFHVKDYPGPHCILRLPSGREATPASILEAAALAAHYSANKGGSASVIYTKARNVRKIPGAKPGLVRLESYSTIHLSEKERERWPLPALQTRKSEGKS